MIPIFNVQHAPAISACRRVHNRVFPLIAVTCIGLSLISCAPTNVLTGGPSLPQGQAPVAGFTPLPSVINVPLQMRASVIEQMLNKQIPELLFQCDTLALGVIKPVKIRIHKGDSARISLEGDEVRYTIPLRLWLQFSFTIGALGVSHTEYQDVEAGINLSFKSRLFVKNDWSIATMTREDGYAWTTDPVIKVRFLTIPIKPVADFVLSTQQKTVATLIDGQVNSILNIKRLLMPAWQQIQEPLLISKNPALWLRLTPRAVYMTQLKGAEGRIQGAVGIQTVAETFVGDAPQTQKTDSLPDFVIPGRMDSSFIINLYGEMSYDAASRMLQNYLLGRSFSMGKKEIVISGVEISGLGGYAVVSLEFFGSLKGKVYVIGRPAFDTLTSTVSIEDLEFDLTTKNSLHKAASEVLHGIILTKVKPFLRFPLKEKLLESQLTLQKMLCHSQLMENVYLTGSIDSLSVGGVRLTDHAMRAAVFAKGSLTLSLHE